MRVLGPLLPVLHGVNRARRALYRRGTLHAHRLPRPVVSIGNLSMGGSGKTPATIAITKMVIAEGLRPAILSRGYRRKSPLPWETVSSDDVVRFGDEPVMLARALPGTPVIVGADRYQSGSEFLRRNDCDLFLLDDGFQHLRLHRDCDILIIAPGDGLTRENHTALSDADILIVRNGAQPPEGADPVPTFPARLEATAYRRMGTRSPVPTLAGRAVVAFSGLANNAQFFATLRAAGADIRDTVEYRDHHRYSARDIELLVTIATENAAELVTTEKDWVKIRRSDIGVVEAELVIERADELLRTILSSTGLAERRHA